MSEPVDTAESVKQMSVKVPLRVWQWYRLEGIQKGSSLQDVVSRVLVDHVEGKARLEPIVALSEQTQAIARGHQAAFEEAVDLDTVREADGEGAFSPAASGEDAAAVLAAKQSAGRAGPAARAAALEKLAAKKNDVEPRPKS